MEMENGKKLVSFSYFQADSKSEIDIQAAVKMPPMPGQSRSLLQFDGVNNDIADMNDFQEAIETTVETVPSPGLTAQVGPDGKIEIKIEEPAGSERSQPPYSDHDYTYSYKFGGQGGPGGQPPVKTEAGSAWIEEDAPPMVSLISSFPACLPSLCEPHVVIVTAVIRKLSRCQCPSQAGARTGPGPALDTG